MGILPEEDLMQTRPTTWFLFAALLAAACTGTTTPTTPGIMSADADTGFGSVTDDATGSGDLEPGSDILDLHVPFDQFPDDADTPPACTGDVECSVENEFGVCPGLIRCTEAGLTECDAPEPAQETCNGMDDDCDGDIDEVQCDDENPCTEDICLGEEGCINEPLTGPECDDGDACTEIGACEEGLCVAPLVDCEDINPCTDDTCDPAAGCQHVNNADACDDQNPCTIDDNCVNGECIGFEVPCECQDDDDCAMLEDDDLCNGTLFCDPGQFPQSCSMVPGSEVACPDAQGPGAACLAPACDSATGECSFIPANEGVACTDADACTAPDICQNGICVGQGPLNCNDGNPCTDDSCEAASGCVNSPNTAACSDDDVCTLGDTCADAQCAGGPNLLDCNDDNPCTADVCDPTTGCQHEAADGQCDDGNACTENDHCVLGVCKPGSAIDCDDQNPCTTDACYPLQGCAHGNNQLPCDDGNACSVGETCGDGECGEGTALNCNDSDPCTEDNCHPQKGCFYDDTTAPCNDQDVCTVGDHCNKGECLPGTPLNCDDGNVCTDDSCTAQSGCVYENNQAECDDNNTCTTGEACTDGTCQGQGSLDCDDGNPCTKDSCLPDGGCQHDNSAGSCSDDDPCTLNDASTDGQCVPGPQKECDDSNPCTDDLCDADGICQHLPNEAPCTDSNPCTDGDACVEGLCVPAGPLACDDKNVCTTDSCDPNIGCVNDNNDQPCTDSDVCTLSDTCTNGACAPGAPLDCDDENVCTDDSCDPAAGCQHEANILDCDDGNPCTEVDSCLSGNCLGTKLTECDDAYPCTDDWCDPLSGCEHALNTAPCDDQNVCTTVDVCAGGECVGGTPLECDDGDDCTADLCSHQQGCYAEPISPCCGNAVTEPGEHCDDGDLNGAAALDACRTDCTHFGAFEHVVSMDAAGQVLSGNWAGAVARVSSKAEDCLVRFDNRVARPMNIEYTGNALRFDFQALNGWHDGWDAYAYVYMEQGGKAGVGSSYRRGHDNIVWNKDINQHANAEWLGTRVDLYCHRDSPYQFVASFDAAGETTEGSWDDLYEMVTERGAVCKLRFDNRIAVAPHVEYGTDHIYFDFLGLHAHYNGWDSYAYIHIAPGSRAGIAAAYRRGYQTVVALRDRQQHAEAERHDMTVDVFCKDVFDQKFVVNGGGVMTQGKWDDLVTAVVDQGNDCRIVYDARVSSPEYIEYTDTTLRFDFINLHAYHDQWECFAEILLDYGGPSGIRRSYRRGHANEVWKKTTQQHSGTGVTPLQVTVLCDSGQEYPKVLELSQGGAEMFNQWTPFYNLMRNNSRAYECKLRLDGRVMMPPCMEHGDAAANLLSFTFATLSSYYSYNGYEAYATAVAHKNGSTGIASSYRRGHQSYIYKRDRDQYSLLNMNTRVIEFLCK